MNKIRKVISAILVAAFAANVQMGTVPLRGGFALPFGESPCKLAPETRVDSRDFRKEFVNEARDSYSRIELKDGARVVVVGGGPAGSFFAINLLKKAKEVGKKIEVVIIEEKKDLQFYGSQCQEFCKEGCNYCAGGISPRMSDDLKKLGLTVPPQLIQDEVHSITVQGDWKNMELRVPRNRRMFSVYRGARPKTRADRFYNFDSWLLEKAKEEGARVIAGKAYDIKRLSDGRPTLKYKVAEGSKVSEGAMDADFLVFAGGVNHPAPGAKINGNGIQKSMRELMPGFAPPKARRALIFELEADEESLRRMKGEVFFVEYGSKDLRIEMCSIMPKGKYLTVVLIGPSIDDGEPRVKERFLELPHIKKLLPKNARLATVCACSPNMTVVPARNPFGDRVAVVGDAVASRLYKDGIWSAYLTASVLANTALESGIDRKSLKQGYGPLIRRFRADNFFGRFVFMLNRLVFKSPSLSRILYQAISSERKMKNKSDRKLEGILWKIASGDDAYVRIFFSMLHPLTIKSVIVGGALVTLRNYITERIFGVDWRGIGRYPTGVYKEVLEAKREELITNLGAHQLKKSPEFESMYSIRIRSGKGAVLRQLGKFGDRDVEYFTPRMIKVRRVKGGPNEAGSVIRYRIFFGLLSFNLVLEDIVQGRYLVYEVKDGFAKGGILVFDIEELKRDESVLSIYVAFNVPKGRGLPSRIFWRVFGWLFPGFLHDVVWNHSLCKLKDVVEDELEVPPPPIAEKRTIDVPQGNSAKTAEPGVTLEAGLTVCLAVAAHNQKTGERVMAHFIPSGHTDIARNRKIDLAEAKEIYIEGILKDIKGRDWQVTVIPSEKSVLGEVISERHILPVELRGYLINKNGVDPEKVKMYPNMLGGIVWRQVAINDKGEMAVKEHDVLPGTLWMQEHAVRESSRCP